MIQLDVAGCRIRSWQADDLAALVLHADNPRVAATLRDVFPSPYTEEDGRQWLAACEISPQLANLAIELDGESIGGIGIRLGEDVSRHSAEIGYWLGERHWGRGIATAALQAYSAYLFSARSPFDLVRLWAGVFEWNAASTRVLEKAGYVLEGSLRNAVTKNGRLGDELLYAKIR